MKTLTTLFVTLVLLITIGLRALDTSFALSEAPSTATMLVNGDGAPSPEARMIWAG